MKRYRNEWKYCCSEGTLSLLESRLRGVLPLDPHIGPRGQYMVNSLYFDDYWDTAAAENDAGISRRSKYRIRYYDTFAGKMNLERKEKRNGRCSKSSCPLTLEEYRALCGGDVFEVIHKTSHPLLKKFCYDIITRMYTPKAIISYERVAYIEPITNIRITFDKNIFVSPGVSSFLDGEYSRYPLQGERCHILEVKFDDILPGYIRNTINSANLQMTTFSKYFLGRKKIEEVQK